MIRPIRFDPDRVARLETESWRAYYDRRWLSMARVLVAAHREQFGLSPLGALLALIVASSAASNSLSGRREATMPPTVAAWR